MIYNDINYSQIRQRAGSRTKERLKKHKLNISKLINDKGGLLKEVIINGAVVKAPEGIVCYQGVEGAWSHAAAMSLYPDADLINVPTFTEVFEKINTGSCAIGILPIDNTTTGIVNDIYDLIISNNLYIIDSIALVIQQALLACKDTSECDIDTVYSHPQALAQCSEYIRNNNISIIPVANTALAAKMVAESCKKNEAAIASATTARIYDLMVLKDCINNTVQNSTRFVAVAKTPYIAPEADRTAIAVKLEHKSGALAEVLNVMVDYGLNLSKIQSLPIPGKPWEYMFYIDIDAAPTDRRVIAVLSYLEAELPEIRLLGSYRDR